MPLTFKSYKFRLYMGVRYTTFVTIVIQVSRQIVTLWDGVVG